MVGPYLNTKPNPTVKFLCSYGGKILPRYPDGKLRYHGGQTRVLSVDRSISFAELLLKLGELCGTSVSLRCQLPTEDLDALVSITSDEDLANLIEEYDRAAPPPSSLKIRAFLSLPKSIKKISPPPSTNASSSTNLPDAPSPRLSPSNTSPSSCRFSTAATVRRIRQMSKPVVFPLYYEKSAGKLPYYAHHHHHHHHHHAHGSPSQIYLIHNGNHWQ